MSKRRNIQLTGSSGFSADRSAKMVAGARLVLTACRHVSKVFAAGIVCCLFITSFAWAAGETKVSET